MKKIPKVSLLKFLKHSTKILENPLPFHHKNFEALGDTFELQISLTESVYFSRDASFLKYVLQTNQKNYTKSKIQTKDLAKYVGKGLLTAEGSHWQQQRKMIQPAFHKKQLVNLLQSMQDAIEVELSKIRVDKPQDIFPVCNDLAFQTVAKSLFSGDVSSSEIKSLQDVTEAAQKMLVKELRQPYKVWWFKLSGEINKHINLIAEARKKINKLIERRKASNVRKDDLLDMLLSAQYDDRSTMPSEQLIDEILILFTAGHETTSNALSFTAQLLAKHPTVQQKVFEEASKAKKETNSLLDFIKQCPYTQQVIEESMRLYPPAYFIDRVNLKDDSFNGMHFKKGANILFSVYEIHKSKNFWEHPEAFKPDRFAKGTKLKYSQYYYPFGAGPRMCIGNNFAMYEMILAITHLVTNYKIDKKSTPIAIEPLITLKPKNAILTFQKRD